MDRVGLTGVLILQIGLPAGGTHLKGWFIYKIDLYGTSTHLRIIATTAQKEGKSAPRSAVVLTHALSGGYRIALRPYYTKAASAGVG